MRPRWGLAGPRIAGAHALTFARREPLILVLALLAAAAYSLYAVVRHAHLDTSIDLGIFDQAIWHYSRFEMPESTLAGSDRFDLPVGFPSILGDHFHPILVTLAPLYWIWADPRMLLIAQGALIAASIVPVFLFARMRLGRLAAYLLAIAYALFWAIHSAVGYDFHEVAFAPLLIALAILFAERERWRATAISLGLLMLVKEDLAIFVVFFGLYLLLRGHRRQAAIAALAGIVWFFVATEALIPLLSDGREFRHWSYPQLGDDLPSAIGNVISSPGLPLSILLESPEKLRTILYLIVPFGALILYSPIAVLALPLIGERMLSIHPGFWSTDLHYSLSIAAVIAIGSADGLRNVIRHFNLGRGAPLAAVGASAAMLAIGLILVDRFPVWQVTKGPGFYKADPAFEVLDEAGIPDDASVAAQARLVPHFSRRDDIYVIRRDMPEIQYIAYTPGRGDYFPNGSVEEMETIIASRSERYDEVLNRNGVRVLRHKLAGALKPPPPPDG